MTVPLNDHEMDFLRRLNAGRDYGPITDNAQDRARQRLRRFGLVKFYRTTWSWAITDDGKTSMRTGVYEGKK